jgi:hypothetical protein
MNTITKIIKIIKKDVCRSCDHMRFVIYSNKKREGKKLYVVFQTAAVMKKKRKQKVINQYP